MKSIQSTWQAQDLNWPENPDFLKQLATACSASLLICRELDKQAIHFHQNLDILLSANGFRDYDEHWQCFEPEADFADRIRRFRRFHSACLAWRDINQLDQVPYTLKQISLLAECCIELALRHAEDSLEPRFGHVQHDGQHQRMTVLGMGKLGGYELNFSSDIDLIFCYQQTGETSGPKSIDHEQYYRKLGQLLIQSLDDTTAEGFAYRVDMRLRPHGKAGRLALSHAAMETYYQSEGRMWERYALIKARPVAGDIPAGETILQYLKPFIYRRYLDYNGFDDLRQMKRSIHHQYQDQRLEDNIKLGPGGIREIEFFVQSFQLIWGGRIQALQEPPILAAIKLLLAHQFIDEATEKLLHNHYLLLRRVENHLQAWDDKQTQTLHDETDLQEKLATGLQFQSWQALQSKLNLARQAISRIFASVFEDIEDNKDEPFQMAWERVQQDSLEPIHLETLQLTPAEPCLEALHQFLQFIEPGQISLQAKQRLDRLIPAILKIASTSTNSLQMLKTGLELLKSIAKRSAYLALLQEHLAALEYLLKRMSQSSWLNRQVCEHPLLLDDVLDSRNRQVLENSSELVAQLEHILNALPRDDHEQLLIQIGQFALSQKIQIAIQALDQLNTPYETAQQLSILAEVICRQLLVMAEQDMMQKYGRPKGDKLASMAILAYGTLGSSMMSFHSDLDLVFLYDGCQEHTETDGPRSIAANVYFARMAQRFIHYLTTQTAAGRLYEIDIRLRPNGNAGMLVSTLTAFEKYQQQEAWTWEQQALIKARMISGEADIRLQFDRLRTQLLTRKNDIETLKTSVLDMRDKIHQEKLVPTGHYHLKNSPGGLLDMDFTCQFLVLALAHDHPELSQSQNLTGLLAALEKTSVISTETAQQLASALNQLSTEIHRLNLQENSLAIPQPCSQAFQEAKTSIQSFFQGHLLDFQSN